MAYRYYRPVTIDHTQVSGSSNLTNFPVPFKVTLNAAHVTSTSGYDVVFSANTNGSSPIAHVIDSYNNSTGVMNGHFLASTLSYTADTALYCVYGDSGVTTSQQNASGCFTAYANRYGFNGDITDSKGGVDQVALNTPAYSAAHIGTGLDGGASNTNKCAYRNVDLNISSTAFVISMSVKLNTEISTGIYEFFCSNNATSKIWHILSYEYNGGTRRVVFDRARSGIADDQATYNTTLGTSNWHRVAMRYDGSNVRGFLDGSYVGQAASSGNGSSTPATHFGVLTQANNYYGIASAIADELRIISGSSATDDWLITEWNSLNSASFATFGTEVDTQASSAQLAKVGGIALASIAKYGGIAKASIKKVGGLTIQ